MGLLGVLWSATTGIILKQSLVFKILQIRLIKRLDGRLFVFLDLIFSNMIFPPAGLADS